jgi:hypothetical protein
MEWVWTFEREKRRLSIARRGPAETPALVVLAPDDRPREYRFADLPSLIRFQTDMETFLLRTNWALVKFSPERRHGRDRRTFPRLDERRRWWSDGSKSTLKVVWG